MTSHGSLSVADPTANETSFGGVVITGAAKSLSRMVSSLDTGSSDWDNAEKKNGL